MAPSRKRAAAKAAAAAAARRQWKVGDLVLAKVKGFPAWPATVSEPEKWGYQADWKKVLVYFFGTQQIAFCNPADVEAFTEEKKQSLLTKRQGKGADFVRAVQEIIDSYEKSKKQEQIEDLNCEDEATLANGGNSVESSAQFDSKDHRETSEATTNCRQGHSLPTSDGTDVEKFSSLHDREALLEQPTSNAVITEKPIITTYTSRKRSGGLRSRKRATQTKVSSVEKSRSSSRLESYGFQNFMKPSTDGKNVGGLLTNVTRDRSVRRHKRSRRSPDASEGDDEDSSAFVSNGSIEDNGSEIITGDSDSFSLNEGSTLDSGCKLERSETVVECLEGDIELSKGLDFQIKAVVIKKKRKPNRKRAINKGAELTARLETEAGLEVGLHNNSQNSENACVALNERYNKDDGDEHLPLVKRARVRMGKSSLEEEHINSSQAEEKMSSEAAVNLMVEQIRSSPPQERASNEAAVNTLDKVASSTNSDHDLPAADIASSPKVSAQIPGNRSQLLGVKEIQSFGCSADGEAALPPSKRLHRALEAMSANAAEEGPVYTESPTMKTVINESSFSSMRSSFQMGIESKDSNGLGEQSMETLGNGVSAICSTSNSTVEESSKSSLGADICSPPIEFAKCQEPCKGVFPEVMDHDNGTVCKAVQASSPQFTPDRDKTQAGPQSNKDATDPLICQKDLENSESARGDFGAEKPANELDNSGHAGTTPSQNSWANEATKCESGNRTNLLHCSAEDPSYVKTDSLKSHVDDSSQADGMFEMENDVKSDQRKKEASYVSVSDGHLGDKDTLGQSSPLPGDGGESPARTSPTATSVCHVSTSESANCVHNSSYSSPNANSRPKKTVCTVAIDGEKVESSASQRPKSVGKCNNYSEVNAALSSFEFMLGSLTRTKESIGRATRTAIDCAKLGVSSKVVEILARSLETESNLHRRVDLFFLVDSITQCSRGLKGEVGGIYPSVIQAALPRLLLAAAPPGSYALENRRQCSKVLRLWLERKILPESIIRHHMRELDPFGGSASAGPYSRRSARTERALDDPVRDMEGMLVDEYGSNSSFQLPGFCMPRMLRDEDEGSDSDGGSFEAVTPEHNSETPEERETTLAVEKHTHILEDVDGELEMEDVAPSCEVETRPTDSISGINGQNSRVQFEQQFPVPFIPPLPQDVPPSSPPLPSSPPPPPPPPPPLLPRPPAASVPLSSVMPDPYASGLDSKTCTNSHSMQDDSRQPMAQQSVVSRINSSMPNPVHYHAPECIDQMQVQPCDTTSSYSNYPVRPLNNSQHNDGSSFQHSAYPPRPPPPPPPNQFSYVQPAQHMKSQRETPPPPYPNRLHSSHNVDSGNFYNNHERMRPAPYEQHNESWRFPAPPFHGPRYHDEAQSSYPPVPYGGPPREQPRLPHQDWGYPPRGMHHRNVMPFRPPPETVPVANRAPSIWRPR